MIFFSFSSFFGMNSNEWYAENQALVSAERFDMNLQNVNWATINTHRILTDLDLLSFVGSNVTLGDFGDTPNAQGATLSEDDELVMQPASAEFPGGVSIEAQSFLGEKTHIDDIISLKRHRMPATSSATVGVIEWENGEVDKRCRIHNYSAYEGFSKNFFGGNQAGNFTMTGTINLGLGDLAGNKLTSGNSNTLLNAGPEVTTSVGTTLLGGGGGNLKRSDYSVIAGTECCQNLLQDHGRNAIIGYRNLKNIATNDTTAAGNNAVLGDSNFRDLSGSSQVISCVAIGSENAMGSEGIEYENCVITGKRGTFGVTTSATACTVIASELGGPPNSVATRTNECWIGNFNREGTPATLFLHGVHEGVEKYLSSPAGFLSISDKEQVIAIPEYPGVVGPWYQELAAFSFTNNTSISMPFDVADIFTNAYIHRNLDTLVVDTEGVFEFIVRYHSTTSQVNLICTMRKNLSNFDSHCHYLGKQILGLEQEPFFYFRIYLVPTDVISFAIGGIQDTLTTDIGGNGTGAIQVTYFRPMAFEPAPP
jgi:hypothetical protein